MAFFSFHFFPFRLRVRAPRRSFLRKFFVILLFTVLFVTDGPSTVDTGAPDGAPPTAHQLPPGVVPVVPTQQSNEALAANIQSVQALKQIRHDELPRRRRRPACTLCRDRRKPRCTCQHDMDQVSKRVRTHEDTADHTADHSNDSHQMDVTDDNQFNEINMINKINEINEEYACPAVTGRRTVQERHEGPAAR